MRRWLRNVRAKNMVSKHAELYHDTVSAQIELDGAALITSHTSYDMFPAFGQCNALLMDKA